MTTLALYSSLVVNNIMDSRKRPVEYSAKSELRPPHRGKVAYSLDLFRRNLMVPMLFAVLRMAMLIPCRLATFANLILHIVGRSAKKQMFRVDASRIVAFVANKQTGRDWPIHQFPRIAMRLHCAAAMR